MKRKFLRHMMIGVVCIGGITHAQMAVGSRQAGNNHNAVVGQPIKIVQSDGMYFRSAHWSPDGNFIAFTGSNYKGIWVKDIRTSDTKMVSDETAAGFGMKWSPDSRVILSRVARYDGAKRLNAVKMFDVVSGAEKLLTEYRSFMPALPHWTAGGEKIYLHNGKEIEIIESGIRSSVPRKNADRDDIVYQKNNMIFVAKTGDQNHRSFAPLKGIEYINMRLSPDGLKIVFEVYGGNLFVVNTDGTGLIDLGKGNRPQWSADSKWIAYMVAEDDGHNITSSDLYSVSFDGSSKIRLTKTGDILEMDPSWSPDGKSVLYHEMNEGVIYSLPVEIQ